MKTVIDLRRMDPATVRQPGRHRDDDGTRPDTPQAIHDLALAEPGARDVGRVLSMYAGSDDALVTIDRDFDTGTDMPKRQLRWATSSGRLT